MKDVRKEDKAVSSIIATILLIGITVVLAATLITVLSGFTNSSHLENVSSSLSLSNQVKNADGEGVYFLNVSSVSVSPPLGQITIEIYNGSSLLYDGPITNSASGNVTFSFTSPDFSAGNIISITLTGKNSMITTIDLIYASSVFSTVSPS